MVWLLPVYLEILEGLGWTGDGTNLKAMQIKKENYVEYYNIQNKTSLTDDHHDIT